MEFIGYGVITIRFITLEHRSYVPTSAQLISVYRKEQKIKFAFSSIVGHRELTKHKLQSVISTLWQLHRVLLVLVTQVIGMENCHGKFIH